MREEEIEFGPGWDEFRTGEDKKPAFPPPPAHEPSDTAQDATDDQLEEPQGYGPGEDERIARAEREGRWDESLARKLDLLRADVGAGSGASQFPDNDNDNNHLGGKR